MTEQPSMTALLNQANEIFYRVGNGTGEVVVALDSSHNLYVRVGVPFVMRNAAPLNNYGAYFIRCNGAPPYRLNVDCLSAVVVEELALTEVADASILNHAVSCFPELYARLVDKVADLRRYDVHTVDSLQRFIAKHKEQE